MTRAVAIGESLVELSLGAGDAARIGYAGDAFATAVYLRRMGLEVGFATAIGRGDPFSTGFLRRMAEEGVDASLVTLAEGRLPGLYAIDRGGARGRGVHAWRGDAPFRDMFRLSNEPLLRGALRAADLIYLTGLTLAALDAAGRARLIELLGEAAHAGAAVALDVNWRPGAWASAQAAIAALEGVAQLCRFISYTEEDSANLGGWRPPLGPEAVERLSDRTVRVRGEEGELEFRPARAAIPVVDATGAGDAFNAAYLALRIAGRPTAQAVTAARTLAEAAISHPGAVIPSVTMPILQAVG